MEISKTLVVIFDLDGTLVRLPIDYVALRRDLKKLASGYGVDSEFRPIIGEVERLSKLIKSGEEFVDKCIRIIEDYEDKATESATPTAGAKDCLILLKNKGKRIAVVSNNSISCVKNALKSIGLSEYVDVVVGREGLRVKPDPYAVILAINRLGVRNEDVIMIGDSENDIRSAERAGIRPYIFKGGDLFGFVSSIECNND